jgi:hypothetical protein
MYKCKYVCSQLTAKVCVNALPEFSMYSQSLRYVTTLHTVVPREVTGPEGTSSFLKQRREHLRARGDHILPTHALLMKSEISWGIWYA